MASAHLEIKEAVLTRPAPANDNTQAKRLSLEQRIALAEAITAQKKAVEKIKQRLSREKQFNKCVAINAELRDARQKLEQLTKQQATSVTY